MRRLGVLVLAVLGLAGCPSTETTPAEDAAPEVAWTEDTNYDGPRPIFPSCADGVKNGAESDVDCGGGECTPCGVGKVCTSNDDCVGLCKSSQCVLARTCAELVRPGLVSGIYDLDLDGDGPEPALPFYCDMKLDGGGYTLVGKLSTRVPSAGGTPAALWTSSMPKNEEDRSLLNPNKSGAHYVSRIVTKLWNVGFTVNEVRLSLVNKGEESKFFRFDGKDSSVVNWFAAARLSGSSYTDVSPTMMANFFAIAGDPTNHREWFINKTYGSCEIDAGWLVADWEPDPCVWESSRPSMKILYAPGMTAATWVSGAAEADALMIYVR